jgi:hypothetical protein
VVVVLGSGGLSDVGSGHDSSGGSGGGGDGCGTVAVMMLTVMMPKIIANKADSRVELQRAEDKCRKAHTRSFIHRAGIGNQKVCSPPGPHVYILRYDADVQGSGL